MKSSSARVTIAEFYHSKTESRNNVTKSNRFCLINLLCIGFKPNFHKFYDELNTKI